MIKNYFISPLALIALVPLIVEWLKVNLKLKDQVLFTIFNRKVYFAQLIAIGISYVLCIVGVSLNLGFLANAGIMGVIIWGLVIGLAAIGAFNVAYLEFIKLIINKLKKNENN